MYGSKKKKVKEDEIAAFDEVPEDEEAIVKELPKKAEKAEECGLSSPLYYIIDKETGERSSKYPLIYANMVLEKTWGWVDGISASRTCPGGFPEAVRGRRSPGH